MDEDPILSPTHRATPFRWLILAQFAVANLTNAIYWIMFAPISRTVGSYFGVKYVYVNLLSMVFMGLYLPGSLLGTWYKMKYGFRGGMLLCLFFMVVAGWMRYASILFDKPNYALLLIGQSLAGLSQPFLTNQPPKLAAVWFPTPQRATATTIAAMSNVIGIGIGTVLPSIVVDSDGNGLSTLLLAEALVSTFSFAVGLVWFRNAPPIPPSLSQLNRANSSSVRRLTTRETPRPRIAPETPPGGLAVNQYGLLVQQEPNTTSAYGLVLDEATGLDADSPNLGDQPPASFWEELKVCFRDRNFVTLVIGFGMALGLFNSVTTLIEQFVAPAGYSSDDASMFGGALLVAGLLSAGMFGVIIDHTKWYVPMLKLLFVLSFGLLVTWVLCLRPGRGTLLTVVSGLMGAVMLPVLPIAFECGVECMYPVEEEVTSGIMMTAGQLTGLALTVLLGDMLHAQHAFDVYRFEPAYVLCVATMSFAQVFIMLYRGGYHRMLVERSGDA